MSDRNLLLTGQLCASPTCPSHFPYPERAQKLFSCSRCRKIRYCSTDCQVRGVKRQERGDVRYSWLMVDFCGRQRSDWKLHKPECTPATSESQALKYFQQAVFGELGHLLSESLENGEISVALRSALRIGQTDDIRKDCLLKITLEYCGPSDLTLNPSQPDHSLLRYRSHFRYRSATTESINSRFPPESRSVEVEGLIQMFRRHESVDLQEQACAVIIVVVLVVAGQPDNPLTLHGSFHLTAHLGLGRQFADPTLPFHEWEWMASLPIHPDWEERLKASFQEVLDPDETRTERYVRLVAQDLGLEE